jgi:hypothetical protein
MSNHSSIDTTVMCDCDPPLMFYSSTATHLKISTSAQQFLYLWRIASEALSERSTSRFFSACYRSTWTVFGDP